MKKSSGVKTKFICKMNFPVPCLKAGDKEQLLDLNKAKDHWFLIWFEKFFGFKQCCFTEELLDRLIEVNKKEFFMSIVPIGTPKLDILVNALEESCRCYCLGLFSASIALSGVAAESLTQMLWEMAEKTIKGETITPVREKEIFGRKFSDPTLSQYRRLQILKGMRTITPEEFSKLDYIRDKRNSTVHFDRRYTPKEIQKIALHCFQKSISLFKDITKIEIKDGKVKNINPYFLTH